jgi:hypothetical protein
MVSPFGLAIIASAIATTAANSILWNWRADFFNRLCIIKLNGLAPGE